MQKTHRKIIALAVIILVFILAALIAWPLEWTFASEVPPAAASDFGGAALAPGTLPAAAANPQPVPSAAHYAAWYWQFLRYDSIAAAIWTAIAWAITKLSITVRDFFVRRQAYKAAAVAARVFDWCLVAADDTWATFTRELKKADGGKLTENHKNASRDRAAARAWELIQNDGMAHLKGVSKDALPYLIDQAVLLLKSRGKAAKLGAVLEALPPPLPDLSPSQSSGARTTKPASTIAACG